MKAILYLIVFGFSFVGAIELLSFFSANENRLNVNSLSSSYFDTSNTQSVYFIGDSYAKTDYIKKGYPLYFKEYFKNRNVNFHDFSKNGSQLDSHIKLIDSINTLSPELVIYFYNLDDIYSFKTANSVFEDLEKNNQEDLRDIKSKEPESGQTNSRGLIKSILAHFYDNSETVNLLQNAIQYISVKLTGEFLKGSPTYKYTYFYKDNIDQLEGVFNSIEAENVIILLNTNFLGGKSIKSWEHYQYFKNIELNDNILFYQSNNIVTPSKYAVSWRNGHPSQEAVDIIADSLINVIETEKFIK